MVTAKQRRFLYATACGAAIIVSTAACAASSTNETLTSASGSRGSAAGDVTTPTDPGSIPADVEEKRRATAASILRNEPQGILDGDGQLRGYYLPSDLDKRDEQMRLRLSEAGLVSGEVIDPAEVDSKVIAALMVVEPVVVRDANGEHTGYLTDHFVSLDDYAVELPAAEAMLSDALK